MNNDDEEKEILKRLNSLSDRAYNLFENSRKYDEGQLDDVIADVKVNELRWRVSARKWYGRGLMSLLFIQNIFIVLIFWVAFTQGTLKDLSLVFSTLVVGTLGETAYCPYYSY